MNRRQQKVSNWLFPVNLVHCNPLAFGDFFYYWIFLAKIRIQSLNRQLERSDFDGVGVWFGCREHLTERCKGKEFARATERLFRVTKSGSFHAHCLIWGGLKRARTQKLTHFPFPSRIFYKFWLLQAAVCTFYQFCCVPMNKLVGGWAKICLRIPAAERFDYNQAMMSYNVLDSSETRQRKALIWWQSVTWHRFFAILLASYGQNWKREATIETFSTNGNISVFALQFFSAISIFHPRTPWKGIPRPEERGWVQL